MTTKPSKLLHSDKTHMLQSQETLLKEIYHNANRSLVKKEQQDFKMRVQFMPSKDWITLFADIGFFFYNVLDQSSSPVEYDIMYEGVQPHIDLKTDTFISPDGIPMAWEPKNGEEIELRLLYSEPQKAFYISPDMGDHVVRLASPENPAFPEYVVVGRAAIFPKPRKVKVTLDELMSTYAQAKCIPADSVEFVNIQ